MVVHIRDQTCKQCMTVTVVNDYHKLGRKSATHVQLSYTNYK